MLNKTLYKSQNALKDLPKWQNFAKSGHTDGGVRFTCVNID